MDKLSNKLRLVRSQSMGVGMGAGAGTGNDAKVMRRTPSHSEGRSAAIVLLDERRLEMLIQPRLYAGELLDLVASHCQLKEKEYFGLAVVDESGHFTWLQLERKVLDHDLPRKPLLLTVHFLVKFFIESISHLSENKTIELFYLQARSLIFRGTLEVESDIVFQLAALSLQASNGDYVDEATTRMLIKKSPILPANVLKEHPSLSVCEDQVIEHYKKMKGQTRGQAVVNYMTIVESMPTYGVHYFEVYDKRQTPWWLGLSCRGIAQYSHGDRKVPVRVFPWKQLENLYFRDKKFSIEVHDAKRVVQTLSSFNLYEDALKLDSVSSTKDELVDAIADSTTQVSVSRRSFNPGSIHVYVWFGKTQGLTKCIWQSAISQHQFYLDRKQAKSRHQTNRNLKEIARDLTRSTASLSSSSSLSNLSRSGSTQSLAVSAGCTGAGGGAGGLAEGGDQASASSIDQQSEETKRARMEMVAALKARREALDAKLKEKLKQLKDLCIKEGELTGELPPEIPLAPGEPVPQIRRRVGTEFALSMDLLKKPHSPEEELLANLELEFEIQSKITSAALKLASDMSASKSVRKQRKISYQQSQRKLKEIEAKLNALKYFGTKHKRKQPRPEEGGSSDAFHSGSVVNLSPLPPSSAKDDIRRGLSVPDLDAVTSRHSDSPVSLDEDEVDVGVSPRSCPASPRKNPNLGKQQPDSVSLEPNSPHRLPRPTPTGYIPSSVYLRSSYRAKQYPTLSSSTSGRANAPLLATTAEMIGSTASSSEASGGRSATLPSSPFRNKYEGHLTQCDSPVGLYNCPQQRTSQAFSSLDDLDALTTAAMTQQKQPMPNPQQRMLPPKPGQYNANAQPYHPQFPVRLEAAAAANNYPSLERSIRKQKPALPHYNAAMANRELPALPSISSAAAASKAAKNSELARSMEDLDSLEAAGIHGRSKMRYREVVMNGPEPLMKSNNMNHHLRTTDEYPPHHSPGAAASTNARVVPTGSHNIIGIRPLETGGPYPTPHTNATLLPGQTYPEPSAKPLPSIASLQDVFYHHQHTRSMSSANKKVETTFGLNDSVRTTEKEESGTSNAPPPLLPKQYHKVVAERRRSGLDLPVQPAPVPPRSIVSESPAVNRKVKPVMATPPIPPLPPTSSYHHPLNESFENVPSSSLTDSPSKSSTTSSIASSSAPPIPPSIPSPAASTSSNAAPSKFVPYRESTKPFEMADFYKYSTKYRKSSASSLKSAEHPAIATNGDCSGSNTDSPRSSTASGSGSSEVAVLRSPAKPNSGGKEEKENHGLDLGDDFSNEMLAWYNSAQKQQQKPPPKKPTSNRDPGKPATLV